MAKKKTAKPKTTTKKSTSASAEAKTEEKVVQTPAVTEVVKEAVAADPKPEKTEVRSVEKPVVPEEKPAESVKAETKKVSKAEAAVPAAKSATPKTEEKNKTTENSDVFIIQSNGKDYTLDEIREMCKTKYKDGTRKHVKSLDVYLKYEEGMMRAYYVVNGKTDGSYIEF